jgi:putative transposase
MSAEASGATPTAAGGAPSGVATGITALGHPGAGTIALAIPQAPPGELLPGVATRAPVAQRALTSVVTGAGVLGVSTWRVQALVQAMGIQGSSRSRVAELAQSADEMVESFPKPWTAGPVP